MKTLRSAGFFLYTLAIYVGLPLIGWGLDNVYGFFSRPQMVGYAISAAAFGLLAGYLIRRPGGMGNMAGKGDEKRFIPRQRIIRILVTVMLFSALLFLPFADRRGIGILIDFSILRWTGLLFSIIGIGLIFWSGMALGRLYSPEVTLQKDHHLVTDGPYQTIRHPRYLGGIVQGIGLSLLFRSWIGLLFTLVFIVLIVFRVQDEEVMMASGFGEEWKRYCTKSWRIIPWVW